MNKYVYGAILLIGLICFLFSFFKKSEKDKFIFLISGWIFFICGHMLKMII
jgi:hypothetical protein